MKSKIEIVRKVLETRQRKKVQWINKNGSKNTDYLDAFTAHAINIVYNALNDSNKDKLMSGTWPQIIDFCFRHIKPKAS